MSRRKVWVIGLLSLGVLALFFCRSIQSRLAEDSPSCPRHIETVIRIAQSRGLHYRGDREDGQFQIRLLISESPLNLEQINRLVFSRSDCSGWRGAVAVMRGQSHLPVVSPHMKPWGNFLLYGDQALISKLTGRTDPDED